MARKTHYEDCDILVVGGGMAGTGAAFEARYWGKDRESLLLRKLTLIVALLHKAYMLSTVIWACSGAKMLLKIMLDTHVMILWGWSVNLAYDMARHVDSAVHMFEE